MALFSKSTAFLLTCLLLANLPIQAELQTQLQRVAAHLLDGRKTEATQVLQSSESRALPESDRLALKEAVEMITQLDSIDTHVLEYFQNQVGKEVQVFQDQRAEVFRVTRVNPPGQVMGVRVVHGVSVNVTIELERIPKRQKVALAETMPMELRGLYASLVAWEEQNLQLFQQVAGKSGPLGAALTAEAVQRVQAARARHQEQAEAARIDAARIRVQGTENQEWERFDEDRVTRIACEWKVMSTPSRPGAPPEVERTEVYHYNLYIPKGYNDNPNAWYPVMFIASPGGNANMGRMAERLKQDRWVVVMMVESRNADARWYPNFLSAHADVMKRIRIAPGAKFATGMSGGARVISGYPYIHSGFRGIILQAAGMAYGKDFDPYGRKLMEDYPAHVAVAMTMAKGEMNYREAAKMRILLNPKCPFRMEIWEGGHTWAPPEVFDRVMDWMEETVFLKQLAPAQAWKYDPDIEVPAQEMHPVAHRWFFDRTLERAERATTSYEKYRHLSRLATIATLGKLMTDPDVQKAGQTAHRQMVELQRDPNVLKGLETEKAYARFLEKYQEYETRFRSGQVNPDVRGFVLKLHASALRAGDEALALAEHIISTHPESPQAKFLSGFLFGLRAEIDSGR